MRKEIQMRVFHGRTPEDERRRHQNNILGLNTAGAIQRSCTLKTSCHSINGGGKNLDDENNESITKQYRKKLLELNDKYKKLIQENESLKQENKNLQKINNNLVEELKKND